MQKKIDPDLVDIVAGGIHDALCDAFDELHVDAGDVDYYSCKLCGETMYPGNDQEHAVDCPVAVLDRAIDVFEEALSKAARGTDDTATPAKSE